jgi:crossover junction endodeoxyribonuclease RusA
MGKIIRTYELPWPPSVNHYYVRARNGHIAIGSKGRKYRQLVIATLALDRQEPMEGFLAVTIDLFPPDKRRRDVDNVLKCLLDAMEKGGAYNNDYQIKKLSIERHDVEPDGKVLVSLMTYNKATYYVGQILNYLHRKK